MVKHGLVWMVCAAVLAAPGVALAQSSNYVPAKVVKAGSNTTPAAGAGTVNVQLFVKKDGTFAVSRVISTTNDGDVAAALEIAKSSVYKPAAVDGKAIDAFFDYVLRFSGAGTVDADAAGGPTAAAYAAIAAGKYDDAKARLQTYLGAHPGDVPALTLLGVADALSGDDAGAAQAFQNVPAIPDRYKKLANQSFVQYATSLVATQKYKDALDPASRAIDLAPTEAEGYYLRGTANGGLANDAAALPDLQKALALARAGKSDDKSLAAIEFSLAIAQLNTGAYEAAAASQKDDVRLDPTRRAALDAATFAAVSNDAIGLANASKMSPSVARFENSAALFPDEAANFYAQAAVIRLTDTSPDFLRAKSEAERALALDPTNGRAHLAEGIVALHGDDTRTFVNEIIKARASPLYTSDEAFAKLVEDTVKKVGPRAEFPGTILKHEHRE